MKKKIAKKTVRKAKPKTVTSHSPADPKLQIALASEMADDAMIEAEMMGEVLPYFVYQFEQEGKTITGMTVKGVNEVVRRLAEKTVGKKAQSIIRVNPQYLIKEEKEYDGEKGIEVSVFAEDLVTGNSAWGVKFEPYRKTGRRGSYKNTFAVEKALSKAERNAKRKLIPETLAMKTIEKIIAGNPSAVKKLEAPKTHIEVITPPKPQPSTPEELMNVAIDAIRGAKRSDTVIAIDAGAQKSEKLSKAQKEAIHSEASAKVDALDK